MKISIIDPAEDKRWDDFVTRHRFGSVYHLSGWTEVLKNTFSYQPYYLILEDNGSIKAGLPFMTIKSWLTGTRLVSLPRVPYCDPLVDNEEDMKELLNFSIKMMDDTRVDYLEIKTQHNHSLFKNIDIKSYKYFKNHILSLDKKLEEIWKSFHRSCVKQPMQRAERNNVKVREGETEEDLRTFYTLVNITAKKHLIPIKPYSFFSNIWTTFHPTKTVLLLIAEIGRKPAAANMSFKFKEKMYYEFLGLDYNLLHTNAGHLLLWRAIQHAHNLNYTHFDFGLTPPDNKGLMDFKRRCGAQERDLSYFYFPEVKGYRKFVKESVHPHYPKDSFCNRVSKKLKRTVASKMYRHFG